MLPIKAAGVVSDASKQRHIHTRLLQPVGAGQAGNSSRQSPADSCGIGHAQGSSRASLRRAASCPFVVREVTIEGHRYIAYEDSAERSNVDFTGSSATSPSSRASSSRCSSGAKYSSNEISNSLLHFVFRNYRVAQQPADHRSAQYVVLRKPVSAHRGNSARSTVS